MPENIPFTTEELATEEWRDITGCPRYEISNLGRVRSWCNFASGKSRAPRLLKPHAASDNRLRVTPVVDGEKQYLSVHRMVLEAFVGPCPDNFVACHNDDNCWNNRVGNLRWDTVENNLRDQSANNKVLRGERHGNSKLTKEQVIAIRNRYAAGEKSADLAKEFGVLRTHITDICAFRIWKHVGGSKTSVPDIRGQNNGLAKLTWDDVRAIRERSQKTGESAAKIARSYPHMNRHTIASIVSGKTWKE